MMLSKQFGRGLNVGARPSRRSVGRVTLRCRAAQGPYPRPSISVSMLLSPMVAFAYPSMLVCFRRFDGAFQ
jgi:hypothetical protein